jgi:surface antigen
VVELDYVFGDCVFNGGLFFMPKRNTIWQFVVQHRVVSIVAGQIVVLAALVFMLLGNGSLSSVSNAFAASCTGTPYVVRAGDTLSNIAESHQTTVQALVSDNKIANPNLIFADQQICLPPAQAISVTNPDSVNNATGVTSTATPVISNVAEVSDNTTATTSNAAAVRGTYNNFPYGQCTWWADQRYFQLHGVYVPWTTNSNANVWTIRAAQYNWKISTVPTTGSIMMLSPGVEGAFSDGHVAIVEKLLGGNSFQVSQMNWNGGVGVISYGTFTAEPGVYFISIS